MLTSLKILVASAIGIVLGLAVTYAAVNRGISFALVRAGPWVAAAGAGSPGADPYEKANLARSAEIPLGLGEGLSFVASVDSAGSALSGACAYEVRGEAPPARYWTISAMTPQGDFFRNAADRYGFTSTELLRRADGSFTIAVARGARSGNWLPLASNTQAFVLTLRLYDTPIAATASTLTNLDMPRIERKSCS